jgi:phosphate:Na+ symporter
MSKTLLILLEILGSLGVFLFGMRVMSEGIQKVAGEKMRHFMETITKNRFTGIFTGAFITSIVQSSSATTVMVVSFVNARLLTLRQSIGVIMGANLGTTFTFWIISILGLKFSLSHIALPMIGIALPFLFSRNSKTRDTSETIIGFGLLFIGLSFLKDSVPDIKNNPEVLAWLQHYTEFGFLSIILFIGIGIALTIVVQSSSVAGAITLTMAYKGWINFEIAGAIVMGENIGTTITAYLASIGTGVNAKRAARAHFMFNIIGVCWMLCLFYPFTRLVDWLIPGDANDNDAIANHLAMFHTSFNFCNILVLTPFIAQIEKLVIWLVPEQKADKAQEGSLKHISAHSVHIGELDLIEAEKEITRMASLSESMFRGFMEIYLNPSEDMSEQVKKIKQQEDESDKVARELVEYLIKCSSSQLSEKSALHVVAMTRAVSEIESICDWCKRLTNLAARRYRKNRFITSVKDEEIIHYSNQVLQFFEFFRVRLNRDISASDMETALELETQIDSNLKTLRKNAIQRMYLSGDIKAELLYIDILSHFERIGNHALNILQALRQR